MLKLKTYSPVFQAHFQIKRVKVFAQMKMKFDNWKNPLQRVLDNRRGALAHVFGEYQIRKSNKPSPS
jgi:hypothetical protein